jgi:hypothetical protein
MANGRDGERTLKRERENQYYIDNGLTQIGMKCRPSQAHRKGRKANNAQTNPLGPSWGDFRIDTNIVGKIWRPLKCRQSQGHRKGRKANNAQTSPLGPSWGAYAPTWLHVHITELSNCLDTLVRKFNELEWVVIFKIFTVSMPMAYEKRFENILDQCFSFWGEFSSFSVKYFRKGTYCHKFSGFWKTYCQKIYNCLQHERVLKIFLLWYLEYLQIWSNILMNGWHLNNITKLIKEKEKKSLT